MFVLLPVQLCSSSTTVHTNCCTELSVPSCHFGVPWTIWRLICVQFHLPLPPPVKSLFLGYRPCRTASSFQVKTNEQACFSYVCFILFPWLLLFGLLSNTAKGWCSVQTLSLVSEFFKNAFFVPPFPPSPTPVYSIVTRVRLHYWNVATARVARCWAKLFVFNVFRCSFILLPQYFERMRIGFVRACVSALCCCLWVSVPEWQEKNQSFFFILRRSVVPFFLLRRLPWSWPKRTGVNSLKRRQVLTVRSTKR